MSKQQEKLRERIIQSLVDNRDFEGELGEYVDTAIISLLADSECVMLDPDQRCKIQRLGSEAIQQTTFDEEYKEPDELVRRVIPIVKPKEVKDE